MIILALITIGTVQAILEVDLAKQGSNNTFTVTNSPFDNSDLNTAITNNRTATESLMNNNFTQLWINISSINKTKVSGGGGSAFDDSDLITAMNANFSAIQDNFTQLWINISSINKTKVSGGGGSAFDDSDLVVADLGNRTQIETSINLNWTDLINRISDVVVGMIGNVTDLIAADKGNRTQLETSINNNWSNLNDNDTQIWTNISNIVSRMDSNFTQLWINISSINKTKVSGGGSSFDDSDLIVAITSNSTITFLDFTGNTHNGNITNGSYTGYTAANRICEIEFTGSHMCNEFDVSSYIQTIGGNYTFGKADGWVISGSSKYAPADHPVNDCLGWQSYTTGSTDALGNYWKYDNDTGGYGTCINCGTSLPLSCCR